MPAGRPLRRAARAAGVDGGEFAAQALAAGAWGVIVGQRARRAGGAPRRPPRRPWSARRRPARGAPGAGARPGGASWAARSSASPGRRARRRRRTSSPRVLAPHLRTHANAENLNTEIGLPLTMLEAERGVEALVLEMAMRGEGQIAELVEIAEPDVGVIVNVGPVHLELLGTVERVAAAKAELVRDLRPGSSLRGPGRRAAARRPPARRSRHDHVRARRRRGTRPLRRRRGEDRCPRGGARARAALLRAAQPAQHARRRRGRDRARGAARRARSAVRFSSLRGEIVELAGGVTVVNDCYNANPMSMRAALQHLAETPAERRVAVLGTMAELGPGSDAFHRDIGEEAAALGIDVLITVGAEATPVRRRVRRRDLRRRHARGGRRAARGDRPARATAC